MPLYCEKASEFLKADTYTIQPCIFLLVYCVQEVSLNLRKAELLQKVFETSKKLLTNVFRFVIIILALERAANVSKETKK